MNKKNELAKKAKKAALEDITKLADAHQLTLSEIEEALIIRDPNAGSSLIIQLLAYMGSILIVSGMAIYLGKFWTSLNGSSRILFTLGGGIFLYILAMTLPKYLKIIPALFFASVAFQILGLFAAINELGTNTDIRIPAVSIFSVLFFQQFFSFLSQQRTSLLFISLALLTATLIIGLDLINTDDSTIELDIGILLFILAYIIDKTTHRSITDLLYLIGGVSFLAGFFDSVQDRPIEVTFFFVSCLLFYISTLVKNRTLLFVAAISAIGYVGYFANQHLLQSAAWPILLAVLGIILFGAGSLVLKLSKDFR